MTEAQLGKAVQVASDALFKEVKVNVRDGIYSEEEGSRIIMGAALFLVMLGDAFGGDPTKIDNPFWELN